MNKKLTLLLDETVIDQAKRYAHRRKETLSGMIENFLRYITAKNSQKLKSKMPREIEALVGIIKIPDELDIKKDYRQGREEKTLHE
jgi:hypothetical protein